MKSKDVDEMSPDEYRDFIKKEHERLFCAPNQKTWFYHLIIIGDQETEGVLCETDFEKLFVNIFPMKLRCRYNSHRGLKLYAFRSEVQIDKETIDQDFLDECQAILLY